MQRHINDVCVDLLSRYHMFFGFFRGLRFTLSLFLSIYSLSNIYLSNHRSTTAAVRTVTIYGSAVWHMPKDATNKKLKTSTKKPTVMRNRCLRTVAGAFKATPIPVLEAETFIAPIDYDLDQLQAKAMHRPRAGNQAKVLTMGRKAIANKPRGKGWTQARAKTISGRPQNTVYFCTAFSRTSILTGT